METPKRRLSWLESFPPDIWAYFAWYLPGEQIGRLMMTGATLLCERLKFPGVVKIITLGEGYLCFKSFPAFLRELPSLEELIIESYTMNWSDNPGITIDMLPSGLRKLELDYSSGSRNLFGEPGSSFMLCKHLPRLETLNLYLEIANDSWMPSNQSLTKLHLTHWGGDVELPPSLIHFAAGTAELSTQTLVSKLPPSLESFEVFSLAGLELVLPLLPPSTQKLMLYRTEYADGRTPSRKLVKQLPKSLTRLEVDINFESTPELISLLPSTLTELWLIHVLPCSAWKLLPPQLRRLTFVTPYPLILPSTSTENPEIQHEIMALPFDSLPRSITRLELIFPVDRVYFCDLPSAYNPSYFPPQLTYISIPGIQLFPATVKLLPSSLTYLKVGNFCERVCQHLPNSLKTLISTRALMSPNLFKFLPKSLTHVELKIIDSEDVWFDEITGEAIFTVSTLPEYTTHMNCLSTCFDWKDPHPLPPTLTYLSVRDDSEFGDSFLKNQQLPNLQTLKLGANFTDLSIHLLPPHLTYLGLWNSSSISGKSFSFLPRTLTYLQLRSSESIFDADIQHLPRALKAVILNSAIHLTNSCIPDLPPHLEVLNLLRNSQITPSSFPSFPYSLRAYHSDPRARFLTWEIYEGRICLLD